MKLKKLRSTSRSNNRALITYFVKVLISYVGIHIIKFISFILLKNMFETDTTDNIVAKSNDKRKGYLVCWISTLAQQSPKIIKTDDIFTKYSEDETVGLNFYLIKTSIVDKNNTRTEQDGHQSGLVAFDVRIHQMAYTNTKYNKFITKSRNLFKSIGEKRPWRKVLRLKIKESKTSLKKRDYQVIRYRALKKRWFQKFLPDYIYNKTILLRIELLETLPCGICQFEVTPIRLKDGDYSQIDNHLWKFIFDEIHQFFHDHHFPPSKSLAANVPRFSMNRTDITSLDNDNIRYYISKIGIDLTNQLDEIYRSYQQLLVSNKTKRERGQKKIRHKKLLQSAMGFFESCDTLLGIHAFLSSVIHSPQNTRIVLNREIPLKRILMIERSQ